MSSRERRPRSALAALFGSLAAIIVAGVTLVGLTATGGLAADVTPPPPPASGPGGTGYPWATFQEQAHTFADGTKDYWTFDPSGWQGPGAAPSTQPLVVFLHGWLGDDPQYYQDWIAHTVRMGAVVVFPRYQTSAATPPSTFTGNALFSVHDALTRLAGAPVRPDTSGMTLIGHSYGGPVIANIANRWASEDLPRPTGILFAEPFDRTIDASLSGIPATTKIDCLVGDADTTVGRTGCDAIWALTGQVPAADRDYVWMSGDDHGSPALVANHRAPTSNTSASTLDALDYYAFWKLGDAVKTCGADGTDCAYALGGGTRQTYMGEWSDGTPVTPLSVTTGVPPCPPGTTAKGC